MANRYWVGGTASWDGTAGTKWSATSGGSGGASVPTSADDVFFDNAIAGSNGTVTIATGNTGAKSITCTGFIGTLTGTAAITVSGSVTLVAGMTYSHTGTMTFNATGTLTTAGKTFSGVTVNGAGITLTLGDALNTSTRALTVTAGTFDTANFTVTALSLSSSNSNTRTITLGSSTVNLSTSGTAINFLTSTNLTFNANTSQINLTGVTPSVSGGSQTFYNVSFTDANASLTAISLSGTNTFNNLTLTAPSGPGFISIAFAGDQTINGTLTCAGATALRRLFVRSNTLGTARTLTVATLSADDCDFRDIALAGTASGASPTRAGDCGGNTNITFPAAKTVYRVGTNTTWGGSSSWALSSGAGGADTNFPLPQDTAVINNDTTLTGTLSLAGYNYSAMDASARTSGITLDHSVAVTRYGSYALGSGVTISGTSTQTFAGRGTMDFTSAGKTITFAIIVDSIGGTLRLIDATTISLGFVFTQGTLNLNGFTLTSTTFSSDNLNTRTLAFGTGNITVTSTGTVFNTTITTGLTVTGTPVVNVTNATATATTVTPGSPTEANSISFNFTAGTYSLTISAGSVLRNVDFTGFAGTLVNNSRTIYGDIKFSTGMTLSAGANTLTFGSTSATTRDITTNGKTLDFPITFNGAGGTWRLIDALTMGSTRTLTHTNGTINLNGLTLTVGTSYTTATGTKDITFNGGTLVCPGTTNAFNNAQPTNFTTTAGTGTGTINFTSGSTKDFITGARTYNCTINNGGAGTLRFTGSATFTTLANSVQPTTFLFTAGSTTTITNWNVNGTAGNLVTIGSVTAATHTLSKASGIVNADYLSISYSTATGGATWYAGSNSTNGGNNSGWLFTGVISASASDSISFSDLTSSLGTFGVASSDSISFVDSSVSSFVANNSLTDSITIIDSNSSAMIANNSLVDSISLLDTPIALAVMNNSVSDSVSFVDSSSITLSVSLSVSDSFVLTDASSNTLGAFAFASDSFALLDAPSSGVIFQVSTSDVLLLTDFAQNIALIPAFASDTITLTDETEVYQVGLWVPISSGAANPWSQISSGAGNPWSPISSGAANPWTPIT